MAHSPFVPTSHSFFPLPFQTPGVLDKNQADLPPFVVNPWHRPSPILISTNTPGTNDGEW